MEAKGNATKRRGEDAAQLHRLGESRIQASVEALSAKSEEALKPIEHSGSCGLAADLLPIYHIDVLERPSSYEGRKDSPVLSLSEPVRERHRME